MPKLKTKKTFAKRLKITKTGQVVRLKRSLQHFARHGSKRALRAAKKTVPVFGAEAKKIRALLGI